MNIDQANAQAVEKMMEARPILTGLGLAKDVIPGMKDNLLLHAGPPITWDRMSGPLRGAVIGALMFEGKAKSENEARAYVELGAAGRFLPIHWGTFRLTDEPVLEPPRILRQAWSEAALPQADLAVLRHGETAVLPLRSE